MCVPGPPGLDWTGLAWTLCKVMFDRSTVRAGASASVVVLKKEGNAAAGTSAIFYNYTALIGYCLRLEPELVASSRARYFQASAAVIYRTTVYHDMHARHCDARAPTFVDLHVRATDR